MSLKLLLTGAAGFIGFHTSRKLLARGDEVVGLDNLNDYYDPNLKRARLAILEREPKFRFVKMDLADKGGMKALFTREKFKRVVHLAAQAGVRYSLENPQAYIDSNVTGTLNVLEGCRHNGVELMAHNYAALFKLPVTGLRFFTVYGPWGRPDMALFLFTKNILEGKPIDVFNHGNHKRDFTFVEDIAEGVVRALDRVATPNADWSGNDPDPASSSAPFRIYNIGNNQPVPLMHYIEVLEQCLGKKAQKNMLPLQLGDVPETSADINDLVTDVGYRPATTVEEGVKRFVDWYLEYYGHKTR